MKTVAIKQFLLPLLILIVVQTYGQKNGIEKKPTLSETEVFIKQTLEGYPWSDGVSINYVSFEDSYNNKRIFKIHVYWKMENVSNPTDANSYYEFNVEDLQSVTFVETEVNVQVFFTLKEGKVANFLLKEIDLHKEVPKFCIYLGKSAIPDNIPERLKKAFDRYIFLISGEIKSTAY